MAPFKSKSQVKACYAQQAKAKAQGKKSKWNCKEWSDHTGNMKALPNKASGKKKGK